MGREHDPGAGDQARLLQRHLARSAQLADALDRAEEAVALVEVKDTRIKTERAQGPHATDAEHDLLTEAPVGLGHVEPVGDVAEVERVGLQIGVEQEERHPADLGAPDGYAHTALADRRLDLDIRQLAHRQLGATVLEVDLELAAAAIDVLPPKALPVQETHRDQRKP